MQNLRFQALKDVQNRKTVKPKSAQGTVSTYYAENVFNLPKIKGAISSPVYQNLLSTILHSTFLSRTDAEEIAVAMKTWALSKGATHYTHWFQPLTGSTAEKHDAFFEPFEGGAIEKFTGEALVQQEPDASSFPNGGIRNTFEARGYSAWDPSSPAFIMEQEGGKTLCIPTVFVAYTGEALDYKAPLLKAVAALDKAATSVGQYFDKNITKVNASLGIEQEYFLVDKTLFNARPDLMFAGRTLFGHMSAKGQQLEDHYFGSIPERAFAFMVELEYEALRLGIPLKTRHNEVAPSQFECAPIYEEINLAIDHNQLLMDLMEKVADRHNLKVLLHEKPFSGLNGSGKHNNWSLITNTGKNLLSPGKTPKNNLMFLTFFVNTIKAVHEHADLLRASIASVSNDHRLGANEAPPAIISIFLGQQLNEVLDEIEFSRMSKKQKEDNSMWLGIPKIPQILLDNTDRNRTSPFAFTGNKFELRAVGSSANSAASMTVLNAIVARQLVQFKDEVDKAVKKGTKKDVAILTILKRYIKESRNIRFEGNGYSAEWEAEATDQRGLANIKSTPKALDAYVSEKSLQLFSSTGVFTRREVEARHEILLENFFKKLQIEARIVGEVANTMLIPATVEYQNIILQNIIGLSQAGMAAELAQLPMQIASNISNHLQVLKTNVDDMLQARKQVNQIPNMRDKAIAYDEKIKPYLEVIRYHADKLEQIVDDKRWPLPKFRELLFIK